MSISLDVSGIDLRGRDLARSVAFYERLGFVAVERTAAGVRLAVEAGAAPILTLIDARDAPAAPRDAAWLFHAALLLPNRGALAAWLRRIAAAQVELDGLSDHAVSEAVYLRDPEGNGLEFYADRPQAAWPFRDGEVAMVTEPLNVRDLLAEPAPAAGTALLAGARWGHVHLRVTDLERSAAFYADTLGMQTIQRTFPGARFLAADGYHHHVGLNTWGSPRQRQPDGALGLARVTFRRRGATAGNVNDPDGMALRIEPLESET